MKAGYGPAINQTTQHTAPLWIGPRVVFWDLNMAATPCSMSYSSAQVLCCVVCKGDWQFNTQQGIDLSDTKLSRANKYLQQFILHIRTAIYTPYPFPFESIHGSHIFGLTNYSDFSSIYFPVVFYYFV